MKNNDRIRNELIKMIKEHDTKSTIRCVGGFDNFKYLLNLEQPIDFLNLFNDMDVVHSLENDSVLLYRYKPSRNIMFRKFNSNMVYINFDEIWGVLPFLFNIESSEIYKLTEIWLIITYKINGIKTNPLISGPTLSLL